MMATIDDQSLYPSMLATNRSPEGFGSFGKLSITVVILKGHVTLLGLATFEFLIWINTWT